MIWGLQRTRIPITNAPVGIQSPRAAFQHLLLPVYLWFPPVCPLDLTFCLILTWFCPTSGKELCFGISLGFSLADYLYSELRLALCCPYHPVAHCNKLNCLNLWGGFTQVYATVSILWQDSDWHQSYIFELPWRPAVVKMLVTLINCCTLVCSHVTFRELHWKSKLK